MKSVHIHITANDEIQSQIKRELKVIKKMTQELQTKMATALELLTSATATLDAIDEKTTAEGAEVKALADAYEALKNEIGKDSPEVVAALEGLNARLMATGERVASIYTAPTAPEVPSDPAPVEG